MIWSGLEAVAHAFAGVGWGILLVVIVRTVAVAVAGVGWWLIFPAGTRPRLRTCVLLRLIREAANALLPMAQVGGDLIGAGLLSLYAVPGALAAASVIVDVLVQAATQLLFAVAGLVVLVALGADAALARIAALGVALRRSCSPASISRSAAAGNAFFVPPSRVSRAGDSGACSARSMPFMKTWL